MEHERRGWVEIRRPGPRSSSSDAGGHRWDGIINLGSLIGEGDDPFIGLGGITLTVARFSRLASYRGLPPDISREAGDDYLTSACTGGETWIGWPEILAIDWGETMDRGGEDLGGGPREDVSGGNGLPAFVRGPSVGPAEADAVEQTVRVTASIDVGSDLGRWEPQFRLRRLLFRLLADLAAAYGRDDVRLVVWYRR